MTSCNFSPGRMPTIFCCSPGASADGEIHDAHRRDLRHEDLAAVHPLKILEDEIHALLERDPEAGHLGVGDRQVIAASGNLAPEKRHDRAARANHVAVAHDGEARPVPAGEVVCRDKQLVGHELRGAVQVDRVGRLVGGQCDHLFHVVRERGVDDVFRAMDVRLDAFHRVVFGSRHLLQRGCVDDEVHAVHRLHQAVAVAHVADEVAHAFLVEVLLHLELLELIA